MKKKYWISLCIERPEDDSNLDQNFSISAVKYFKDTEIEYFFEEIDKNFNGVYNAFRDFIGNHFLVSHYAYFERDFLKRVARKNKQKMIRNKWVDTQEIMIEQNSFGGTIEDAIKYFNLDIKRNISSNFQNNLAIKKIYQRIIN
jgi:DNA polymerase III alpha subunit (gram-positive type)